MNHKHSRYLWLWSFKRCIEIYTHSCCVLHTYICFFTVGVIRIKKYCLWKYHIAFFIFFWLFSSIRDYCLFLACWFYSDLIYQLTLISKILLITDNHICFWIWKGKHISINNQKEKKPSIVWYNVGCLSSHCHNSIIYRRYI